MGLNFWVVYCGGDILAVPPTLGGVDASGEAVITLTADSFKFELEQAPAGAADLRLVIQASQSVSASVYLHLLPPKKRWSASAKMSPGETMSKRVIEERNLSASVSPSMLSALRSLCESIASVASRSLPPSIGSCRYRRASSTEPMP